MKLRNLWLAALIGVAAVVAHSHSADPNPGVAWQGPDHYSFTVGEVRVTALSDGTVPQDLHVLVRNTTVTHTDQLLRDAFLANPTEASINAFLFKTAGRVVLVDTGAGDFFGPGFEGKLLESLASIHVSAGEITDVLLTHAHDDHMGGLVHNGQLVFPNAVVHLSAAELAFFLERSNAAKEHYAMSYFDQAFAALKPEQDAGKISTFQSEEEIIPGVWATVHSGHTPGSTFYELRSRGQSVIFVGDIIHCAAVQLPDPNVTITYDVDSVKAAAVRRDALASFAKDRTLIAVPHLPFPGVGHIKPSGKGYEWVPVLYENRDFASGATFQDPHKNGDTVDPGPAQCGSLESKKIKRLSWKPSTRCSTSGTMHPPSASGRRTAFNTALMSHPVVRSCSIWSRVFHRLPNMSPERLWLKVISSSCMDEFRASASP